MQILSTIHIIKKVICLCFDIEQFLNEMQKVAKESIRVLKPGRQCAILIGDTRKRKYIIPLGFKLLDVYLKAGFKLKEVVIKQQHNCKTTGFWYNNSIKYNFLLLAHEYLFIFEKPKEHNFLITKEPSVQYNIFEPTQLVSKKNLSNKLDKLETTTIWKFPKKYFEEYIDRNVINRYANNGGYSIFTLIFKG